MVMQRTLCCGFLSAVFGFIAAAQPTPPAPVPLLLQNYKPVTAERLTKPDDGDWMMVRRTYDASHSPAAAVSLSLCRFPYRSPYS